MAVFAVDFINMIFISMLGKAELAAAIGYAGAILFFTSSFGIGMSIAAGALVARALGAGERETARRRATSSLIFGAIFGAAFAALIWAFVRPFSVLLGAQGTTLDLTVHYLQIVVPSLPLLLIGMVAGAILRAHGDAARSMWATIGGAVVNAILDPILIFGFGMELTGAAISTNFARLALAGIALVPLVRIYGGFGRPNAGTVRMDFMPVLGIAVPAILTQLATPMGQAFVTRSMSAYGEEAVAGMAIISRLTPVAFCVIFALSGAVGPIMGQNFGAGQHDRVRGAFRDGIIFTAIVSVAVSGLLFVLRGPLQALFQLQGEALTLVMLFAGPISLLWFFNGVIFVANAAYNNLGHPFYSTVVNWGRHTVGTVPFVMVFAMWYGASGVLIGQAVGGAFFALGSWSLARWVMKRAQGPVAEPIVNDLRVHRLLNNRR